MSKDNDKKYSVGQIALNLTFTCFVCGLIIAIIYFITAPVAAKNAEILKEDSMKTLVKEADNFIAIKGKSDWYEAQENGKTIAYVVQSTSKGYGGEIKLLVAIDAQEKVIGYNILSHNETPGLGDKTTKSPFKDQFEGKEETNLVVTKDKADTEDIQAVTGATISSRAVTKGVQDAVKEVNEYLGGK